MGAEINFYRVKCKKDELEKKANSLRKDCLYDFGHAGYTGTIAEDNGQIKVINVVMSEDAAEEYINEKSEKWEDSIAIPLNEEKDTWLIGGCYSC